MKQCKQGYYYCYTDEVCKPIPKGLRVTARFSGGGKEPEETGIDVPTNGNGDGNGGDGGGMSEGSLFKWFQGSKSKSKKGKKGKPGWVNVLTGGTCASDEPGEGVPKCVSRSKYDSMTKAERKSAARRKKTADSGQQEKSGAAKPTYVSTDKPKKKMKKEEVEIIEAKDKKGKGSGSKDACYKKVKASAKVWPSAYASGRLVQCRKKGAANWGNKSESIEYSDWRDDFKATEYEFIDIIKAEPLISEASFEIGHTSADVRNAKKKEKIRNLVKQGSTKGERSAAESKAGTSLPSIKKEEVETVDELKCWKGYKRKKGSVPGAKGSCVKENEEVIEAKDETEIGITGKPIPNKKWRSPKKRHEFEKKRREAGFTSTGPKYKKSDVSPYYNPLQKNHVELEGEKIEEKKEESKIGGGNLKKLTAKAVKRIDYDVDGDVDPNDKVEKKTGDYGEELPTPFGKFKTKIKKEEFSDWRDELDEGWKSALAGAGVAAALMSQGGQKAPDKKTTTSPSRSNTERVSKTTQKKLSPMDQWRKNYPGLAKKSDNPPEFKRKKLSRTNKDWAKANPKLAEKEKDNRSKLREAIDKSKMKCNSPKSQAVGDSQTGKSHVVKACEGGKEKIIRFGQRGVKGSPKKEGESKEYASRRNRFKTRHAKNISKGKMSAAYWSNKVKW